MAAARLVPRRLLSHARVSLPTRAFFSINSAQRTPADDGPSFAFRQGPSPPKLPKEEQEIFEQLQKQSTGAFSAPRQTPKINQSPDSEPAPEAQASENGGELHPDMRSGVQPEFDGEKNPKTGEIGGPKNEPLRWGSGGDWSYGGRVTDF